MATSNQTSAGAVQRDIRKPEFADRPVIRDHDQERSHDKPGRLGHKLAVFQKELRHALMMQFRARFAATHSAYAENASPADADEVAREALGAARQVAAERPTDVAKSMVTFRAKVRQSAEFAQKTVGQADQQDDVENAVAKLEQGLAEVEDAAASQRESSASVLDVDMRSRQRSTIRIRTQEGDVVRFDLKRVDRMTASDQAVNDDDGFMSLTEVETSSRTRLMLRVRGDINESEMRAIQNVFGQAEAMANEFFGGDLAAAFSRAESFDFDAEQLARVNMRFRSQQVSTVAYRETIVAQEPAAVPAPSTTPVYEPAPPRTDSAPEPVAVTPSELPSAEPKPVQADETAAPVASPEPDESALSRYFDQLADFLRAVGEGFEAQSFRYHYSESFKLTLLNAVMHTVAPEPVASEQSDSEQENLAASAVSED